MKKQASFASIGDLCIDWFEDSNQFFLGGTAYNTAISAVKAGANVQIFSSIGTDKFGQAFRKSFSLLGIDSSYLRIFDGKTSQIKINRDKNRQPTYADWRLGVLSKYSLGKEEKNQLKKFDIAKLTFFKPLQKLFDDFSQTRLNHTLKVADFAGSSIYSCHTSLISRYINNFDVVVKSLDSKNISDLFALEELSLQNTEKVVLALLGEKGSVAFFNGKRFVQPSTKVKVIDATGAGDAYMAQFLVSYLAKRNIPQAMLAGSQVASEVVAKPRVDHLRHNSNLFRAIK